MLRARQKTAIHRYLKIIAITAIMSTMVITPLSSCQLLSSEPPVIIGAYPNEGVEGIFLDSPIEISFDRLMNKTSTQKAFLITPKVDGTFSWRGNTLVFQPSDLLKQETEYTVRITNQAKSFRLVPLAQEFSFNFKTLESLKVILAQPQQFANPGENITIMFNQPIMPLTKISNTKPQDIGITINPKVEGNFAWLSTSILEFIPEGGRLPLATDFEVEVPANISSISGTKLDEDFTFGFTTQIPKVVASIPLPDKHIAGPDQKIYMQFNQKMDKNSVENAFLFKETAESAAMVKGKFDWADDAMSFVFTPAQKLKMQTSYEVSLSREAKGSEGEHGLETDYSLNFTTVGIPQLMDSSPANGATNVHDIQSVDLYFSNPMEPTNFENRIKISPAIKNMEFWWSNDLMQLTIYGDFKENTNYGISILKGLADVYGQVTQDDKTISFSTTENDPVEPYIYIEKRSAFGIFDANAKKEVYVSSVNAGKIDLKLYRLSQDEFIDLLKMGYIEPQKIQGKIKNYDTLKSWAMTNPSFSRNKPSQLKVELSEDSNGQLGQGFYLFAASLPGGQADYMPFAVNAYSVTFKKGHTTSLIWASDNKSGENISNADVEIFNSNGDRIAAGLTNSDGVYLTKTPLNESKTFETAIAIVRREEDLGICALDWTNGIEPYNYNIPMEWERKDYNLFIYTDRPIYRPEQKVMFKGIIRQNIDMKYAIPPADTEVSVTIYDSASRQISTHIYKTNQQGTFWGEIMLGKEINLGRYYMDITVGSDYFSHSFFVEEYRKPEFSIDIMTDKESYISKETIKASVLASYYFGAPVTEAELSWKVTQTPFYFYYEEDPAYDFIDYDYYQNYPEDIFVEGKDVDSGEGKTDSQGRFDFEVYAGITNETQSQQFFFNASVNDINNQSVSESTSKIVHKGDFYIGLKAGSFVSKTGSPVNINAITLSPDQNILPDKEINIEIYKREWNVIKKLDEYGNYYWESQPEDKLMETKKVRTSADGKTAFSFTPTTGGLYRIVAFAYDEKRNKVRTATEVWISSPEYISWFREENYKTDVILDKKDYEPGDMAKVLLTSPFVKAKALVTLERGNVLEYFVKDISQTSQIYEIPVSDDYIPNVFISAILFQGSDNAVGQSEKKDSPKYLPPEIRVGFTELKVKRAEKELNVELTTDKEKYEPGEEVKLKIKVTDQQNKPVESNLVISVVDAAVLALIADYQEKIIDSFYGEALLGVYTANSQTISINKLNINLQENKKGGDGEAEAPLLMDVRKDFRELAYWNPEVQTDKNGEAEVSFKLPDSLTEWKISAVAFELQGSIEENATDFRVGSAIDDFKTSKDIMIRPIIPRFLTAGDKVKIGAVIHNYSDSETKLKIVPTLEGGFMNAKNEELTIPAGKSEKIYWEAEVPGMGELTFKVSASELESGDIKDQVEVRIPINAQMISETVSTSGLLDAGQTIERIAYDPSFDEKSGGLNIDVFGSPAAGVVDSIKYLNDFPYRCVEQTASQILGNLVILKMVEDYGLDLSKVSGLEAGASDVKIREGIYKGLSELYSAQNYDGGWGWWVNSNSNPYLTVYVLFVMQKVQSVGYDVSANSLKLASDYISSEITASAEKTDESNLQTMDKNTLAFFLYTLAISGNSDLALTQNLYEFKNELDVFGKSYLAIALNEIALDVSLPQATRNFLSSKASELIAELLDEAKLTGNSAHWESENGYYTMASDVKYTAAALTALVRIAPDQEKIILQAARWLMAARTGDHWSTTHDNAFAMLSLLEMMVAQNAGAQPIDYVVLLNNKNIMDGEISSTNILEKQSKNLDMKYISKVLSKNKNVGNIWLKKSGDLPLFYNIALNYTFKTEDIYALSRGIGISRDYFKYDKNLYETQKGSPLADGCKVGDVIDTRIRLYLPQDTYYLILEDYLPAGFEAVNPTLLTSGDAIFTIMKIGQASLAQPPANPEEGGIPGFTQTDYEQMLGSINYDYYNYPFYYPRYEFHDDRVTMYIDFLEKGVYEIHYLSRATLPGSFNVIPAQAYEMYFPEVYGRTEGRIFTIE